MQLIRWMYQHQHWLPKLSSSMKHLKDLLEAVTLAKIISPFGNLWSEPEVKDGLLNTFFKFRKIRRVGGSEGK